MKVPLWRKRLQYEDVGCNFEFNINKFTDVNLIAKNPGEGFYVLYIKHKYRYINARPFHFSTSKVDRFPSRRGADFRAITRVSWQSSILNRY